MVLLAVNFENLHQILQSLYEDMMPLCSQMTGVAKGLAGLGALFYVAYRVWQSLARAEPIDVFPLLRPFALGLCIMFFPTLVLGTLNSVMSPIVTGTHRILETQTFDMNEYRRQKDKLEFEAMKRNPETRSYGDFGSNIFALVLGVPDDRYDDVVATLKHEISVKYDNHLNTGIFGTQFFFETLALNGLNDIAYNAMNQEDFPSFGNWIKQGATVTWEKWNGADSRNHPMFGGGLTWFYRILAGVNVDAERPAYEHIIIKPILDKRLPEVYYSHMTPYGEVVSEIRQTGRNLEMNVTVPVGSTATIYIPVGGNTSEVTESGISVRDSKDVRFERIQDGNCIVRVPQGKYKFKVDNQ